MKKILIVTFLAGTGICHAQQNKHPTRFDKFINQPAVQWAAYASDTFDFDHANLNNILLGRIQHKKIKATLPVISRTVEANEVNYVAYDSIFRNYFRDKNPVIPVMDEQGDIIEYVQEVPSVDSSVFRLTEVTQILYVENGSLKSYVPWVTPTLPVFISSGRYIGESFFFNTAYNFKRNPTRRKRHQVIALGQTKKMFNQNDPENLLKELYGKNLVETIWPEILGNHMQLYTIPENNQITADALNNLFRSEPPVIAPLYDPANAIFRFDVVQAPASPAHVTEIMLVQDWYYNQTKNIVYNEIKELVLYVEEKAGSDELKKTPVLKLVPVTGKKQ